MQIKPDGKMLKIEKNEKADFGMFNRQQFIKFLDAGTQAAKQASYSPGSMRH
jgi:hypothetical protein